MSDRRAEMIREVAHRIVALPRSAPVRVAVDGRTASGKTTFADELATAVEQARRPVIRAQIDGSIARGSSGTGGGACRPRGTTGMPATSTQWCRCCSRPSPLAVNG